MTTKTLPRFAQLAQELFDAIEPATRSNTDEKYLRLKDGSPEWMKSAIRYAHDDAQMLPDDLRYEYINDAAEMLAQCEDEDAVNDLEFEADICHHELFAWLASHGTRYSYVDEEVEENGHSSDGLIGDLQAGQVREKQEVLQQLFHALQTQAENEPNANDEGGE